MATLTTWPPAKRRKHVYGKLKSRSNWNVDTFFEEDESASLESQRVDSPHKATALYAIASTHEAKTSGVGSTTQLGKRQDTFDVPSDDEQSEQVIRAIPLPIFHKRQTLVDDSATSALQLASWERKRVRTNGGMIRKKATYSPASPESQLQGDLERALSPPRVMEVTPMSVQKVLVGKEHFRPASPSKSSAANDTTSAAARLAARRSEATHSTLKRSSLGSDDDEEISRKRTRPPTPKKSPDDDIAMVTAFDSPVCAMPSRSNRKRSTDADVFDLPVSSDDESTKLAATTRARKGGENSDRSRDAKGIRQKQRTRKGSPARSRVAGAIDTDTDVTEPPTQSPSAASRSPTPQRLPTTPPQIKMSSPPTAGRSRMTPKQTHLWSQLLPSVAAGSSPSALAMRDLTISGSRRKQTGTLLGKSIAPKVNAGAGRTRLVDRLQRPKSSTDDEESVQSEDEIALSEMQDDGTLSSPTAPPKNTAALETLQSQATQPQNQSTSAADGPRITYSSARSFLPDSSFVEDFMTGLEPDPVSLPQPTKPIVREAAATQRSAFELDDDDGEEGGQSGIRNIHELRAAGRTISGMYDVQELLSEISNHNASHRSRRRSALLELAQKLSDKTSAIRFIAQSLETDLALECQAVQDDIADFVLATALAFVLVAEPPEHAVKALHDLGVVTWLVNLLGKVVSVSSMAKDRRNNMSKLAQASLIKYADAIQQNALLWGEHSIATMTTRLVALKALDLITGKLRRLGNKSVLVGGQKLLWIAAPLDRLSVAENSIDLCLSVSTLESLSTTTMPLHWPADVLQSLALLLTRLTTETTSTRHTLFLTMRLCLNLTNDNVRNCVLLIQPTTIVPHLIGVVRDGFDNIDRDLDDEQRALALDLLILAMGIMINLTEHCDLAREQAVTDDQALVSLLDIFQRGQKHMLDAESVEETASNVAFGYLAVMLANICQNSKARMAVAAQLSDQNLGTLVEAVEEFVLHYQKVDMMNFEGAEGAEVRGAFTEKLKIVLARLRDDVLGL